MDYMKNALIKQVTEMSTEQLVEAMYTDVLTGCWNRRAFEEMIGESERYCYAIVDLDSLKFINDSMGHRSGDFCLQTVAETLTEAFPDRVFRLSGDEFVVYGESCDVLIGALESYTARIFSFGVGKTLESADKNLQVDKEVREAQGRRAPRGAKPSQAYYNEVWGF